MNTASRLRISVVLIAGLVAAHASSAGIELEPRACLHVVAAALRTKASPDLLVSHSCTVQLQTNQHLVVQVHTRGPAAPIRTAKKGGTIHYALRTSDWSVYEWDAAKQRTHRQLTKGGPKPHGWVPGAA